MNRRDSIWKHVHECLDERTDPLDDSDVVMHLLEHPEVLEEVAALRESLGLMESVSSVAAAEQKAVRGDDVAETPRAAGESVDAPRIGVRVMLALIAAAATLLLVLRLPEAPSAPNTPGEPAGAILSYRMTLVVEDRDRRVASTYDGDAWSTVTEWTDSPRSTGLGPSRVGLRRE